MLHRARVVPLLSLCRCERIAQQHLIRAAAQKKMHWNTHLRTFPPSFALPWGRVTGITGMFAPDYIPFFWEKCGLFCARGVNTETKKNWTKWRSNSIGCDSSPTRLLAGERYDLKHTSILQRDEVCLLFNYRIRRGQYPPTSAQLFSHSNFHCLSFLYR